MTIGEGRRIGLVGCVKQKAADTRPARNLYTSTLFDGRRAYVERTCDEWWILSAAHGVVHPDQPLAPYDVTLKNAGRAQRRAWTQQVLHQLDEHTHPGVGDVIEIHAGAEYRDYGLIDGLRDRGCGVEVPTQGLRIGDQLHFYAQAR